MFQNRRGENPFRRNNKNHNTRPPWGGNNQGRQGGYIINKSQHPWWWFLGSVSLLAVWYTTPVSDWVTEVLLWQVPIQDDLELGRQAARQHNAHVRRDPYWTPRIQQTGWELVQVMKEQQVSTRTSVYFKNSHLYEWDFGIVAENDGTVNAYCFPGGTIRITPALLQLLEPTVGELAALLGHEMGHVLARHSQKRMLSQQLLHSITSVLFSDDNQRGSNKQDSRRRRRQEPTSIGQVIGDTLLDVTDWLGQQQFSRRDEYQADAVAWDLLNASNKYTPQSLQSLLQKLDQLSSRSSHAAGGSKLLMQVEAWSRTHPATKDRIQALEKKWQELTARERRRLARFPI